MALRSSLLPPNLARLRRCRLHHLAIASISLSHQSRCRFGLAAASTSLSLSFRCCFYLAIASISLLLLVCYYFYLAIPSIPLLILPIYNAPNERSPFF
jgi:hypothetical protein